MLASAVLSPASGTAKQLGKAPSPALGHLQGGVPPGPAPPSARRFYGRGHAALAHQGSGCAKAVVACVRFGATALAFSALIGIFAIARRDGAVDEDARADVRQNAARAVARDSGEGAPPDMPWLIYGTAWKEGRTYELVSRALRHGFQGVDVANQRKHYREDLVGQAVQASGRRVFLQSKYTPAAGHSRGTEPYRPSDRPEQRVAASFWSTMAHLGLARAPRPSAWNGTPLDAYLLHGLTEWSTPLSGEDWRVYAALEDLRNAGYVRRIGVSNVSPEHVRELCARARVKPHIVQNRCYASTRFDELTRQELASPACLHADGTVPVYQAFSLLTANGHVLRDAAVQAVARRRGESPAATLFAFARQLGIVSLTGSKDALHWTEDFDAVALVAGNLTDTDVQAIFVAGMRQ